MDEIVAQRVAALLAAGERVEPLWRLPQAPSQAPARALVDLEAVNQKLREAAQTETETRSEPAQPREERERTLTPGPIDELVAPMVDAKYNRLVELGGVIARPWVPIRSRDLTDEERGDDNGEMHLEGVYSDELSFWNQQLWVWQHFLHKRRSDGLPPIQEMERADVLVAFVEYMRPQLELEKARKGEIRNVFDPTETRLRRFLDAALVTYAAAARDLARLQRSGADNGDVGDCTRDVQEMSYEDVKAEAEKLRREYHIPTDEDWKIWIRDFVVGDPDEESKEDETHKSLPSSPPPPPPPPLSSSRRSSKRSRQEVDGDGDGVDGTALPPPKRVATSKPLSTRDDATRERRSTRSSIKKTAPEDPVVSDVAQRQPLQNPPQPAPQIKKKQKGPATRGRQAKRGATTEASTEQAGAGAGNRGRGRAGRRKQDDTEAAPAPAPIPKAQPRSRGRPRPGKPKQPKAVRGGRQAKDSSSAAPLRRSARIAAMQQERRKNQA